MDEFKLCMTCGVVRRTSRLTCGMKYPSGRCRGALVIDARSCHAVLFHGPGHQSTTRCSLPDDSHQIHRAVVGLEVVEWRGAEACTGTATEVF